MGKFDDENPSGTCARTPKMSFEKEVIQLAYEVGS
jgi:hypothetical protein